MFGLTLLGAATYFIYGTLDPHWSNAAGHLAGFLAYDVVLLAPFSGRFSTARGGSLVSLIIYVAFLVYSGHWPATFISSEPSPALDPTSLKLGRTAWVRSKASPTSPEGQSATMRQDW